jgi:hypothetical protein
MSHITTIHNQYQRSNARQIRQNLSHKLQVINLKINPRIPFPAAIALDVALWLGEVWSTSSNRKQLATFCLYDPGHQLSQGVLISC